MALSVLLLATALAAKLPDPLPSADIRASRAIPVAPERVFEVLGQVERLQGVFPADCARWDEPFDRPGVGGNAGVKYSAAGMHRHLQAILDRVEPPSKLDLKHAGDKGFITRFDLSLEAPALTRVTLTTYLQPPPRAFQRYFYRKVQPAWQGCHERTLAKLETTVLGG
jgi:uncharacterized protein YndB with AHSA1/START domain